MVTSIRIYHLRQTITTNNHLKTVDIIQETIILRHLKDITLVLVPTIIPIITITIPIDPAIVTILRIIIQTSLRILIILPQTEIITQTDPILVIILLKVETTIPHHLLIIIRRITTRLKHHTSRIQHKTTREIIPTTIIRIQRDIIKIQDKIQFGVKSMIFFVMSLKVNDICKYYSCNKHNQ